MNNKNPQLAVPINSRRLVLLFGLLFVVVAIPLTVFLIQKAPGEFEIRTKAEEYATLNLKTDQTEYDVGDTFILEIELDTGDEPVPVTGVDAILNYNPSLVETSLDKITNGTTFDTYPLKNLNAGQGGARIAISGGASAPENFFSGVGTFATIEFTAIDQGTVEFSFVWEGADATTDTNIVGLVGGEAVERLINRPASKTITIGLPEAALSLESAAYAYEIGETFNVAVNLNTGMNGFGVYNDTIGTDVILTYDPSIIKGNGVSVGSLYNNYPRVSIDDSQGRVEISGGMSTTGTYFAGSGAFATVEFIALGEGMTSLDFAWDGVGATGDTNVVGPGPVDLLATAPSGKSFTVTSPPPPAKHKVCQGGICVEADGEGTDECQTDVDCYVPPTHPSLSFRVNLLERLVSVGSKGIFKIMALEVPGWYKDAAVTEVDAGGKGIFSGLVLDDLNAGSSYTFYIKSPSYLAKKAPSAISLVVGDNPATGYLDFGDLIPGDIHIKSTATETDQVVNSFDAGKVFVEWNTGASAASVADFNGDEQVNAFDIGVIFKYFGSEADL